MSGLLIQSKLTQDRETQFENVLKSVLEGVILYQQNAENELPKVHFFNHSLEKIIGKDFSKFGDQDSSDLERTQNFRVSPTQSENIY